MKHMQPMMFCTCSTFPSRKARTRVAFLNSAYLLTLDLMRRSINRPREYSNCTGAERKGWVKRISKAPNKILTSCSLNPLNQEAPFPQVNSTPPNLRFCPIEFNHLSRSYKYMMKYRRARNVTMNRKCLSGLKSLVGLRNRPCKITQELSG